MNESAWLDGTELQPMLEALRGKASERKLRLFAVAVCRRTWRLLEDERIRRAVGGLLARRGSRTAESEVSRG